MQRFHAFLGGFFLAAAIFGGGWYLCSQFGILRVPPDQIPFDAAQWRAGGSHERGRMYRDVIKFLEAERPSRVRTEELLGQSGGKHMAYLNGADSYLVYQIDLGQKISGFPYLNKLGIAFHEDGSYSHIAVWD